MKLKLLLTRYIANRAFSGLRKSSAIYQQRQIVLLAPIIFIILVILFAI